MKIEVKERRSLAAERILFLYSTLVILSQVVKRKKRTKAREDKQGRIKEQKARQKEKHNLR